MAEIVERDRRREDFRPDVPVILCDGQTWYLPHPKVRLRPALVDGKVVPKTEHSFGPEYLEKVEAYYRSLDEEVSAGADEFMSALLDLAVSLVRRNYDMTFEEVASILYFEISEPIDETNRAMQEALRTTALGQAQKKTSPAMP